MNKLESAFSSKECKGTKCRRRVTYQEITRRARELVSTEAEWQRH